MVQNHPHESREAGRAMNRQRAGRLIRDDQVLECCDCHRWFTSAALDKHGRCHDCRDKLESPRGVGGVRP